MISRLAKFMASRDAPNYLFRLRGIEHISSVSSTYRTNKFYFVQIGANDGSMQDPLNHFIKKYHWRGILVEPVREYFNALKETYANETSLVFENSAITDRKAKQKIFKIKTGTKNIATWYQGIASFDKNNLLSHEFGFPKIKDHIEEQSVNCITLQNLIDKHNVSKIDLLCIDVEGHEAIIIKQLSGLSIKPKVIFYEHKHLSKDENQECQKILNGLGYTLSKNIFNTDTLGYLS